MTHLTPRIAVAIFIALGTAGTVSGCALLFDSARRETAAADRQLLPSVPPPRNAIDIEVFVVERPAGDTLSGPSLWRPLNQTSGSLEERARLRQAGFQFGLAPSTAPYALQALLDPGRSRGTARETQRFPLTIPSGGTTEVRVGPLAGTRRIPSSDKTRPAILEVDEAQCVFRMLAERVQDGWIRVTLLPEIHHGDNKVRAFATERGFSQRASQEIEQYFDQQFSVELNSGEYVVVGHGDDDLSSLGGLFFRGGDAAGRSNRLLIVHLVGMHEVHPVRQASMRR